MVIDFKQTIESLKDTGYTPVPDTVKVTVPNAKEMLWKGIQYFMHDNAKWLPEYDELAAWLTDNGGRGLLCYGNCGRGKSLICGKILPLLINCYCRKVVSCYDAQQMNANPDDVMRKHIIYVDDIGTESMAVRYGERRLTFAELADESEKKGKLLIVSTNLSLKELGEKYGERTLDRLRAITKTVLFSGESLRQ